MSSSTSSLSDSTPSRNDLVYTSKDVVELGVCILSALLIISSLAVSIYYGIHPIKPMVPIAPAFSLSLPTLICSSSGTFFSIVLIVQLCRFKSLTLSSQRIQNHLIRWNVHHGGRIFSAEAVKEFKQKKQESIQEAQELVGPLTSFVTRDGIKLSGYWHFSHRTAPTVILFHETDGSATNLICWGLYYRKIGFNVLMPEYRGYGLSEGSAQGEDQEMEAYLDAEAALEFVLSKGIGKKQVIAHGSSLGGAYAAALGYFFDVRSVILDHTFTSIADICANKFSPLNWKEKIPSAYRNSSLPKNATIKNAKDLKTDGFNTLFKVKKMSDKAKVFVISGKDDRVTPPVFGKRLVQAKYPVQKIKQIQHFELIKGGHITVNIEHEAWDELRASHWYFLHRALPAAQVIHLDNKL